MYKRVLFVGVISLFMKRLKSIAEENNQLYSRLVRMNEAALLLIKSNLLSVDILLQ